jgi:hypothetical protein
MPVSIKPLTRDWIQYLKNNKIVALQSDPTSGRLNYQRPTTSSDLIEFLLAKTDYSERDIKAAIRAVKGKPGSELALPWQSSERGISNWMYYGMSPGKRQEYNGEEEPQIGNGQKRLGNTPPRLGNNSAPAPKPSNKLKYDPDSVSDVDYREVPNDPPQGPKGLPAPKKPHFKGYKPKLKEDIRDKRGEELSEKDVEAIFKQLVTGAADAEAEKKAASTPSPDDLRSKKEEDLRKMKRLIRDVMTETQRKTLWRMLNEKD